MTQRTRPAELVLTTSEHETRRTRARHHRAGRVLHCAALAVVIGTLVALLDGAQAAQNVGTSPPPWSGFQVIMWQPKTLQQYAALKTLGITAAMVPTDRDRETAQRAAAKTAALAAAGLDYYVENIATDFYSAYHRWFPDRAVNWRFLEAKRLHAEYPASTIPFMRVPSLSDADALHRVELRLQRSVAAFARRRPPLYFNLADETGIADLTAAWDFDWSVPSLAGFRDWLKTQYPSLAALNREWGARFGRWDEIMPETTTAAMARRDGNYARWSDFKAWMDVAFARAIAAGARAVHAGAPSARAAIEGVQIPGWGGYDYSRLAGAVDVMEIWDDGVSLALMRSLDPRVTLVTTSFTSGAVEQHRLWRSVLHGSRGLVLWDEKDEFIDRAGAMGPRGRAAAADFAALRHGIGPLLIASTLQYDPVAILYSPASFRMQWMLDQRAKGEAWTQREADTEDQDNALRVATRDAFTALEELGFTPRFVTESEIEAGLLRRADIRLLVLPQVLALSTRTATAIRDFGSAGGRVASIGIPGQYDAHGRPRAAPLGKTLLRPRASASLALPLGDPGAIERGLAALAEAAKLTRPLRLAGPGGGAEPDVRTYRLRHGHRTLIALQREPPAGPDVASPAAETVVTLPRAAFACDLGSGRPLGRGNRFGVSVGAGIPTVIGLGASPRQACMTRAPAAQPPGEGND